MFIATYLWLVPKTNVLTFPWLKFRSLPNDTVYYDLSWITQAEATLELKGDTYISDVVGMSFWAFCEKISMSPVDIKTYIPPSNQN